MKKELLNITSKETVGEPIMNVRTVSTVMETVKIGERKSPPVNYVYTGPTATERTEAMKKASKKFDEVFGNKKNAVIFGNLFNWLMESSL